MSPTSSVFCDSQRNVLKENDIVRFPKLAETYQRIAEEGPDVFYTGSMAQGMVKDIQAAGLRHVSQEPLKQPQRSHLTPLPVAGGIITLEDLLEYQPLLNENPMSLNIGEYTMYIPDAPSSGPVLALILNIVNGEWGRRASQLVFSLRSLTFVFQATTSQSPACPRWRRRL